MTLDATERGYIREVAVNAATQVSKQIIEDMLKWHTKACPHGKTILASKWGIVGLCIGSGIGGATFFAAISKVFFG